MGSVRAGVTTTRAGKCRMSVGTARRMHRWSGRRCNLSGVPTPASWNQIVAWLKHINAVRQAAGVLAGRGRKPYSNRMEVHVTPETAKRLNELAATSGRAPEDIVEDALAGYLEEVASVRKTLDSRYDDLKSGRVKPIDGEEAFRKLREKSERRRSGG